MEQSATGFKYGAKLCLDEPRAIYYSGQVLSGHIQCNLIHPVNYSAINVNFLGEANVFWTETETEEYNGIRRNVTVKYKSKEVYFNVMQCISGGGKGIVSLPAGLHNIPFQFQIPSTTPSSFTGERGSVSYKVIAYVEFPDQTAERDQLEKTFEVVAPMDLNIGGNIKQPINLEFEETYSCCCSSSPMSIRVQIPASGYCPGQTIPITIRAHNRSNQEMKKIIIQLVQKQCFHSKEPRSDYIPPDEVLATVKTGAILGHTDREVYYELVVPDMIVPNLQNCSIIDVGYFIKVMIKMSGCNDDLEDETEICLGLIPLASTVTSQPYKHPMQSDLPQSAIPDLSITAANGQNNTSYPASSENAAYSSPYPNPMGPYPTVTPYPPNPYQGSQKDTSIGFVVPETPGNVPNAPFAGNIGSQRYPPYNMNSSPSAPPMG